MESLKVYHLEADFLTQSYPIIIHQNGLDDKALLNSFISGKQVLIVTNQVVAPLYLSSLESAFDHLQCDTVILPDGELYKNQDSLFAIYDSLLKNKHHRDTTIVALGGGIIGDLAGFAASTYQRGVRLIQIPTTLLAMVDAAIGGKTAINYFGGKNMVGAFYHPQAVIMDLRVLTTLEKREFSAGFAEIIKYALLTGGDFFLQFVEKLEQGLLQVGSSDLAACIAQCCQIKIAFVKADERDTSTRALLNLGHTVGHALEAVTHYARWLHGEAVAIGLYCAAFFSYKLGDLSWSKVLQVEKLLKISGLPHKIPKDIDLDALYASMRFDKKIKNANLTFILLKAEGACYLHEQITPSFLLMNLKLCQEP